MIHPRHMEWAPAEAGALFLTEKWLYLTKKSMFNLWSKSYNGGINKLETMDFQWRQLWTIPFLL